MADTKKISLILAGVLGVIVLAAGSVAATIAFYPGNTASQGESEESSGDGSDADDAPDKPTGEAHYLAVEIPPVNFGPDDPKRFLQLEFQLMTHDEKVKSAVEKHMPAVRNGLILLLSEQSSKKLATRQGKQGLRESMRKRIESVLDDKNAKASIKEIYLTRMVMQ